MCEQCNLTRRSGLSRRFLLGAMSAGFVGARALAAAPALARAAEPPPNPVSGDEALKRLKEGNQRYAAGHAACRDFAADLATLTQGQYPFASILSCADSRVAPELVFDQGLGDLFVVRVAGNVLNENALASLEYGSEFLGVRLILVLGHSKCGAVDAAIKVVQDNETLPGHLPGLIDQIKPAVLAAEQTSPSDLLSAAIEENVRQTVHHVSTAQPVLSALIADGKLTVAGGTYDLATGMVHLL